MSHIPSFHNRQSPNFSSFPYDSDPSMQRNQRSNNQNLEDLLDQLKRKEAGAENPFYDNSYQHNLNVHPTRGQDPSLDLRSQQYPSISRELDENPVNPEYEQREPVQRQARQEYAKPERNQMERNQGQQGQVYRDYDKKSLQDNNNKGSFWSGLGENNRHKNIVKEYQEYMRNNPIPPPKKGGRLDNSEQERNRAPLRKKQDQEKEWYSRDVGVGILPGMGGQEAYGAGNRRSPEVQQDYRRGVSDITGGNRNGYDIPSRMNQNPSGSRLAGIGSRLIEGERPYYDQMRTPQYTPNKGDMKFNFASPQDHNRRSVEMAGYSNEMDRYSREGANRQPEPILEVEEHNNQQGGIGNEERWQNPGKQAVRDRRVKENGGGNEGMSWVEERQRQEQDKKNRQREDLQRIYREQIEEKKRKKEEEQRIKMLEDQKEEERLRKENEDLQRQFLMEQVKKKEQDNVKGKGEEIMDKDYIAARKRQNKHRAFEVSEASPMGRGNVRVQEQEYEQPEPREENRMIYEQVGVDDMIRETAKRYEEQLNMNMRPRYEFTRDPELEVHREFTRKINATLDEELEKMRKDVDYHSKLIRNELTSYKTQAMVTQELRENAHRELQRLKEELKNQQIMEERRPYDDFEFPAENPQQNFDRFAKSKEQDFDRPDYKIGHQMPLRNYAKSFSPDNDGPDLGGTSTGMDLDFDTNYVPARDAGRIEARLFREPPKLNDLMNKYGVDDDPTQVQQKKDLAMKKFGNLFPEHGGKAQSQDSLAAIEARLGNNTKQISNQGSTVQQSRSYKGNYDAVEGKDEIERIENLLKMYKDESLIKEKEGGKSVKKEVLQDYKKYEQALVKEFGEEGFGGNGSFGFGDNGYGKDEEDLEENEGETPAKSEVELANVTHEVSIAEDRSDIKGR